MIATGNHGYFDSLRDAPPFQGSFEDGRDESGGMGMSASGEMETPVEEIPKNPIEQIQNIQSKIFKKIELKKFQKLHLKIFKNYNRRNSKNFQMPIANTGKQCYNPTVSFSRVCKERGSPLSFLLTKGC